MTYKSLSKLVPWILLSQMSVFAQGISEPLTKGHYELGYSHYWYKGDFHLNPTHSSGADTWTNGTVYFRMDLHDILTISVEAMVWPVHSSKNFPGESFLNYTFGMSLTSPTIKFILFDIYLNVHYLTNMYIDRSEQKYDKRFQDVIIGLPIRYQFSKLYAVWLGPVYIWNESDYFEDQTYNRSTNSAGVSFGLDGKIFKHIYLNLNIKYIDYTLPNIIVGYRF